MKLPDMIIYHSFPFDITIALRFAAGERPGIISATISHLPAAAAAAAGPELGGVLVFWNVNLDQGWRWPASVLMRWSLNTVRCNGRKLVWVGMFASVWTN